MAKGDVMFAATGVTSGAMLRGVRRFGDGADHPLRRDAQQVRHRPLHRRPPQLRDQDLVRHGCKPRIAKEPGALAGIRAAASLALACR